MKMAVKKDYTLLQSVIDIIVFLVVSLYVVLQSIIKTLLPKQYQRYKSIKGEIVLVTGGGGGLGRLLAVRLARLGATVVLWDVNKQAVDETVKLVEDNGGTAYGFRCDLADKEDVYKIANVTRQTIGDVTILINNAGVVSGNLLLDTPDHLIKRTFDVNILAHFWTAKAFLPRMIEKNHGHIVTIASMAGFIGVKKLVDYCSSKYAAVGFDEALRLELEAEGVTGVKTTVVCPYFIQATGMFDNVNSRFLPTLKSTHVADRVVEGLRREEVLVTIPGFLRLSIVLKYVFPWAIISMLVQNLVPDASPPHQDNQSNLVQEKPDLVNRVNTVKNSVATLNHINGACGKNL